MQGPIYIPLSGSVSTTVYNVAPTPVFDIYNYMPIGGPWWVASGTFQDVGLADKGIVEIDWGDESPHYVATGLSVGDTFSEMHRYPPEALSYTISITLTDDDTGEVSYSKSLGLYLLDLLADSNNSGAITSDDEAFGPSASNTGRYIVVNSDDDNENGIADLDEAGPITGENDLEKFLVRWQAADRPEINNYNGWHITLKVPHMEPDQYYLNPRIWLAPERYNRKLCSVRK